MSNLIDRQTAIANINKAIPEWSEDKEIAIDCLKNTPSLTQMAQELNPTCMDCISRQAAIDEFDGAKVDETYCTEYDIGYNDGIDFAISRLSVMPSAQPEIVRCKDCKHYYYADNRIPQEQRYSCDLDGDRWKPEDFCSYAERRTDG